MSLQKNNLVLIFIFIIIAGAFLRLNNLSWETYSYSEVEMKQAADQYAKGNFINTYYIFDTPPLSKYLFAAAAIFSNTEFSLRLVSVLFGILTIVAVFFLCKKLYNIKTGLLASSITAFSIIHLQFSRYVQQETMLSFFYVMIAYFTWDAIHEKRKHTFVFLGIFLGLALATKFISIILIIFIVIYAIYEKSIKISIRPRFSLSIDNWILKSIILSLIVLFLAWPFGFARLHTDATLSVHYGNEIRTQEIHSDIPIMILSFGRRLFTSLSENTAYPVVLKLPILNYFLFYLAKESILIILLLIFGIYYVIKKPLKQDKFILILIIMFFVLLSFQLTNITYRHVTSVIPFLAILSSRCLGRIKIRWQTLFIVMISTLLFLHAFLIGPSYVFYFNPLRDTFGIIDTEAKEAEGMHETVAYLNENCSTTYAGDYYRFMIEPYYDNVTTSQKILTQCVVKGNISDVFEKGDVTNYIKSRDCTISRTVYKNSIKVLDIYMCL